MPEPRIHVLAQEVVDQIAAGEVIERPASAVKELVENSLDAGARRITIDTEGGGKQLIRVTDDGCGMTPEEAVLALERHATSKLRTPDDLFKIRTLGFRGEALPSIAAVSEMGIVTRREDVAEGVRLLVASGRLAGVEPAAAPAGTTVTARRLFFNVPARQKFLKSDAAEANEITRFVQRLALAHPETAFTLAHDAHEALRTPASDDPLNTVVALFGRAVARQMVRVGPIGTEALNVSGFAGLPTLSRANREHQLFFVNSRPVRSPLFYRALDDAYRSRMPAGRRAVTVLFLNLAPADLDVNVHPSKIEVRFRDEPAIHALLRHAVDGALTRSAEEGISPAQAPLAEPGTRLPPIGRSLPEWARGSVDGSGFGVKSPSVSPAPSPPRPLAPSGPGAPAVQEGAVPYPPTPAPGELPFAATAIGAEAAPVWPRPGERAPTSDGATGRRGEGARERGGEGATGGRQAVPPLMPGEDPFAERPAGELRPLGQAKGLFILAEGAGKLWIIDQHVAHERILFDRLTATARREPADPLLVPLTLAVDPREALAMAEHAEMLADLGFAVEPFGAGHVQVRAVPRSLIGRNYEQALRDMVDEIAELSNGGQVRLRREQLALSAAGRACHAAIKAGMPMSQREMEQLLADLLHTRDPYTCPHGRPVFLTLDEAEVAALFGTRTCG